MSMKPEAIEILLMTDPQTAWDAVREKFRSKFVEKLNGSSVDDLIRREKRCEPLELALSGAAWSLWHKFYECVPLASQRLVEWWGGGHGGKAILILDGLSLREAPLLLAEAENRGFSLGGFDVFGSELPAETNAFAKALGFSHRGALDNNGAGGSHKLPGAFTVSNNLPWKDVASLIPAEPKLVVWHHWPDKRVHEYAEQGEGIRRLLPETVEQLASEDFWALVEKLTNGRELIITSDHGYANSGAFRDADNDEKAFFKENFGAQRYRLAELSSKEWLPPLALTLDCPAGRYSMALGRTKWAVGGGNRTLSHGGLTLFETLVPFIRLKKSANQHQPSNLP